MPPSIFLGVFLVLKIYDDHVVNKWEIFERKILFKELYQEKYIILIFPTYNKYIVDVWL